jgi:hypothetical protein
MQVVGLSTTTACGLACLQNVYQVFPSNNIILGKINHSAEFRPNRNTITEYIYIYRVSQEERTILREGVP